MLLWNYNSLSLIGKSNFILWLKINFDKTYLKYSKLVYEDKNFQKFYQLSKSKPDISIIIPVYNTEKYLSKCLDSCINQTYKNIEIICIDDCSTDSSYSILQEYAEKDKRIKVLRNNINRGVSYSRNKSFKYVSGEYLMFLDSDDYFELNACEICLNKAKENDLDYIFFLGKTVILDETKIDILNNIVLQFNNYYKIKKENFNLINKVLKGKDLLLQLLNSGNFIATNCFRFIKTDIIKENKISYIENFVHPDILFSSITMLYSKKCFIINDILYNRVVRDDSIKTSTNYIYSITSLIQLIYKFLEYIEVFNNKNYTECIHKCINLVLSNIESNLLKLSFIDYIKINDILFQLNNILKLIKDYQYIYKRLLNIINKCMSKSKPDISIIIPVYNTEKYLSKCLDSCINQTYKNIEIICIDDCSTDNSLQILNEYAKKDKRIKVLRNNINSGGCSTPRNIGLKNSSGEYLMFLDSDDYFELNACEICLNKAKENDLDLLLFGTNVFSVENSINEQKLIAQKKYYSMKNSDIYNNKIFDGLSILNVIIDNNNFISATPLKFFKKHLLVDNNIFFTENIIYEDMNFAVKLFFYSKRVMYINNKLYNRVYVNNSITTNNITDKNIYSLLYIINEFSNFYKSIKTNKNSEVLSKFETVLFNSLKYRLKDYNFNKNYNKN